MRQITGLGLITFSLILFFGYFFTLSYLPVGNIQTSSQEFGQQFQQNTSATTAAEIEETATISGWDLLTGMFSFSIAGIPTWLNFIGVYLPLICFIIGVVGLIRGV